jgi:hypothetical protein
MARFVGPFTAASVADFCRASAMRIRRQYSSPLPIMTERPNVPAGLETEVHSFQKRAASARDESKHIVGKPPTTKRKLAEIGRQLASLKYELAEIAAEKSRTKKH